MALRYWYRDPDDGLIDISERLRKYTFSLETHAEEGAVAVGTLTIDDPDGDFEPQGHRVVAVEETTAEDPDFRFIWVGYIGSVKLVRGPYRTGVQRQWQTEVGDLNVILSRRLMTGGGNDRPSESDNTRVAWVEATSEGSLIDDTRYLTSDAPVTMDANDYATQAALAVYSDCSQASGKNFFVTHFGDAFGAGDPWGAYSLFYDFPHAEVYDSAARLSNIVSEVDDSTTFYMGLDDELQIDWMRTYSGILVPYQSSYVYGQRQATVDAFARRDSMMPAPNVKSKAAATRRMNRYLADAATPSHRATVKTWVPRTKVNAIREGMRVQVKASHWISPYSDEYTWMRVLRRRVTEVSEADYDGFELTLELAVSTGTPATGCPSPTASGSFYPLGGSGNTPNPSTDGNVLYLRPGIADATTVTPGHQGLWHFPAYGAGGVGTVDYAGDCAQNKVRCIVVGNGTMVVHSETYSGAPRDLQATLYHVDAGSPSTYITDEVQTGTTGDDFTFDVSTHNDVNCTHWVDLRDMDPTCGGKFGFSGFDWTAS